jgi:aquaporin Z
MSVSAEPAKISHRLSWTTYLKEQERAVESMAKETMVRVWFAEIFGTWMLLMVGASIYVLGPISGAHYNPAVTLAFAIRGDFPWKHVPGFWICQMLGAMLAALLLLALFGNHAYLGSTIPNPKYSDAVSMVMEMILTFVLVSIILGTANDRKIVGANAAIAVAATIALDGLWAAPISGASMNPARSLGPAIISGHLANQWIYIVGPCAGAALATVAAFILRGQHSRDAVEGASGVLAGEINKP